MRTVKTGHGWWRVTILLTVALVAGSLAAGRGWAAETPRRGGVLKVSVPGSPRLLDPPITGAGEEWMATSWLYNNLTRVGTDLTVQPDLAEGWESNRTATEWTFKLHRGVKFHHGREMTAEDVVFSMNRILDPKTASRGKGLMGPVTKIEAPDNYTVKFTLAEPVADFPANLSLPYMRVIPKEKVGELNTKAYGTGPFVLKEFVVGDHVTVVRNPNYFRKGLPYLDEVRMLVYPDSAAELAALTGGVTHIMWQTRIEQIPLLKRDANITVGEVVTGAYTPIVMRSDKPPFNDNRVRLAMKYCIDREKVVQSIVQGHGVVANDHSLPPSNPFYHPYPIRKPDIAKAKALLAEAGYPSGLQLKMYTSDARIGMLELAIIAKEMCKPAGFDIDVVKLPWDVFLNTVWEKETFYVQNWFARPTTDTSIYPFFVTRAKGGTLNEYAYSNPKVDEALLKAKGELNLERRKELYAEAQKTLIEEGPAVIPYFKNYIAASRRTVPNFTPHPLMNLYADDLWLSQ